MHIASIRVLVLTAMVAGCHAGGVGSADTAARLTDSLSAPLPLPTGRRLDPAGISRPVGALPLALGAGEGAELRQPLGVSIDGGLIVSQALTLYTTPVVYLYMDRFSLWIAAKRRSLFPGRAPAGGAASAPQGG